MVSLAELELLVLVTDKLLELLLVLVSDRLLLVLVSDRLLELVFVSDVLEELLLVFVALNDELTLTMIPTNFTSSVSVHSASIVFLNTITCENELLLTL